jgi:hypothetical protein
MGRTPEKPLEKGTIVIGFIAPNGKDSSRIHF